MRILRCSLSAFAAALFLVCGRAPAAEDGPTIEEMLATCEAEAAPKRPAAISTRTSRSDDGKKPPALSETVVAEIKKVEQRATERYRFFQKERRKWDIARLYVALEKFREAARVLAPMLRSHNPGPGQNRDRMERLGEIELEYALVMAYLGRKQLAEKMLAEHKRRLDEAVLAPEGEQPDWRHVERLKARQRFIGRLPDVLREIEELKGALAETPDADRQWTLAGLCNVRHRDDMRADLKITRLTALLEMIGKHPEDGRVKNGSAHWELQGAYYRLRLHEDPIRILESMPERFPRNRNSKTGDYLWQLGHRYEDYAELWEDRRDRRAALTNYRKALECFHGLMEGFPKHWANKPKKLDDGSTRPPRVDGALGRIHRVIKRLGGR